MMGPANKAGSSEAGRDHVMVRCGGRSPRGPKTRYDGAYDGGTEKDRTAPDFDRGMDDSGRVFNPPSPVYQTRPPTPKGRPAPNLSGSRTVRGDRAGRAGPEHS